MSAQDFLKTLSAMMGLVYESDEPLPEVNAKYQQGWRDTDAKGSAFYAAHNLPSAQRYAEVRAAIVQSKIRIGDHQGQAHGYIHCSETTRPGFHSILQGMPSTPAAVTGKCTADERIYPRLKPNLPVSHTFGFP